MRRDLGTKIRGGVLKTFGRIIGKAGDRGGFEARVRELAVGEAGLEDAVSALLAARECLEHQIEALKTRILRFAKRSDPCRRLMTIPGVGALTAVSFVAAVDDPARFRRSSGVGAHFGLTPRRHQSGEVDRDGKVSKFGDALGTRAYLFEAAGVLLPGPGRPMVRPEGLGHAAGATNRQQEGGARGARPQVGRRPASGLDGRHRVPLLEGGRSRLTAA